LILDDFALRPFTGAQGDDFYELVSERAQHGSFILTANRSPKDWYELFPNAVVAEGVLDRLVNSSFHVHMEGKSYRPKRRPGQGVKLEKGPAKGSKKRTRPGGELFGARGGELRDVRHASWNRSPMLQTLQWGHALPGVETYPCHARKTAAEALQWGHALPGVETLQSAR
jgi:hypothetical protein